MFFLHTGHSVTLLKVFSIVLLMDNTYKTIYRLLSLEIISVMSLASFMTLVLLIIELENSFIWCLERLLGLFFIVDVFLIIVGDKDIT